MSTAMSGVTGGSGIGGSGTASSGTASSGTASSGTAGSGTGGSGIGSARGPVDDNVATGLLPPTPGQTVGPFFGFAMPYARSNELVEPGTPGAVRLHGTVRDGAGDPVPDALVEIWQADPTGAVVARSGSILRDGTFTGWGRAETNREGGYWFRTLSPGATEPGRAPFFAVTVFARGLQDRLFTRAYLPAGPGAPQGAAGGAAAGAAAGLASGSTGASRAGASAGVLEADPLLASLEPERRATLVTAREPDGSLRFDIRLQGEGETVFLTYDQAPADRVPADQVAGDQGAAEQVSADQIPADQVPTDQVPTDQVPTDQVPAAGRNGAGA